MKLYNKPPLVDLLLLVFANRQEDRLKISAREGIVPPSKPIFLLKVLLWLLLLRNNFASSNITSTLLLSFPGVVLGVAPG